MKKQRGNYNERQPRDAGGRWSKVGGAVKRAGNSVAKNAAALGAGVAGGYSGAVPGAVVGAAAAGVAGKAGAALAAAGAINLPPSIIASAAASAGLSAPNLIAALSPVAGTMVANSPLLAGIIATEITAAIAPSMILGGAVLGVAVGGIIGAKVMKKTLNGIEKHYKKKAAKKKAKQLAESLYSKDDDGIDADSARRNASELRREYGISDDDREYLRRRAEINEMLDSYYTRQRQDSLKLLPPVIRLAQRRAAVRQDAETSKPSPAFQRKLDIAADALATLVVTADYGRSKS